MHCHPENIFLDPPLGSGVILKLRSGASLHHQVGLLDEDAVSGHPRSSYCKLLVISVEMKRKTLKLNLKM